MIRWVEELKGFALLGAAEGEIGNVEYCLFDDEPWVIRFFVGNTGSWLAAKGAVPSTLKVEAVAIWSARYAERLEASTRHESSPSSSQAFSIHRSLCPFDLSEVLT